MAEINNPTQSFNPTEVEKKWYVVDAADQPIGRFASRVARLMRGKHKPSFTPHINCGDGIIVLNANKIQLTGQKWSQKHYIRYSGHPGGKKEVPANEQHKKDATQMIKIAIKGMLPKNKLGNKIMRDNLRVYPDDQHPHQSLEPEKLKAEDL